MKEEREREVNLSMEFQVECPEEVLVLGKGSWHL